MTRIVLGSDAPTVIPPLSTEARSRTVMQPWQWGCGRKLGLVNSDSRWFCGGITNENMNGFLHQYMPKGADLSVYSQVQLDAIADKINFHPCLGL